MESQVTVGFKVPALVKKNIDNTAKEYGMDTSSYLRSILLDKHKRLAKVMHTPDELLLASEDAEQILHLASSLQKKHSKESVSHILIAALKMAKEHETYILSNKLKNFFQ